MWVPLSSIYIELCECHNYHMLWSYMYEMFLTCHCHSNNLAPETEDEIVSFKYFTFSTMGFWSGLFHVLMWTQLLLQIRLAVINQEQNGKQYQDLLKRSISPILHKKHVHLWRNSK